MVDTLNGSMFPAGKGGVVSRNQEPEGAVQDLQEFGATKSDPRYHINNITDSHAVRTSSPFLEAIVDQQHVAEWIEAKGLNKQTLANEAAKNPSLLSSLIGCLNSEKTSVRYGCEKILRLLSEKRPDLVYPYFDTFVTLLSNQNSFLKWGAIITIANLATVDRDHKFDFIADKYFAPISGPVLITAANIIGHAWKIALARPELAEEIARRIVSTERAEYRQRGEISSECRNVACVHAIESLDRFFEQIEDRDFVIQFVRRQANNPQQTVSKKAKQFLKKRGIR